MDEMFEVYRLKDVNIEKNAKSNLESILGSVHELVAREKQLLYYYKKAKEVL